MEGRVLAKRYHVNEISTELLRPKPRLYRGPTGSFRGTSKITKGPTISRCCQVGGVNSRRAHTSGGRGCPRGGKLPRVQQSVDGARSVEQICAGLTPLEAVAAPGAEKYQGSDNQQMGSGGVGCIDSSTIATVRLGGRRGIDGSNGGSAGSGSSGGVCAGFACREGVGNNQQ